MWVSEQAWMQGWGSVRLREGTPLKARATNQTPKREAGGFKDSASGLKNLKILRASVQHRLYGGARFDFGSRMQACHITYNPHGRYYWQFFSFPECLS